MFTSDDKNAAVAPLWAFMNKEKITYFQYARKSSEGEDRQALSIPAQLRDNEQVIKRNNLRIADTFTDEASASIPFNRPAYTDMIRRIKKGDAAGIVVWHVNRLIRNPIEEGEFKWLLQTGVIKSIWTPNREYRSEDTVLRTLIAETAKGTTAIDIKDCVKTDWLINACSEMFEYLEERNRHHTLR